MLTYDKDSILNPYNEIDFCLHLSSTADNDTYRLNNMPTIPGQYTFSIWGKSLKENIININVLGSIELINFSTYWEKKAITVTSDGTCPYIDIILPADEEIWLYEGQLEDGIVPTSWHLAQEDIDISIEKVKEYANDLTIDLKRDTLDIKNTILSWTNGALGKETRILGGVIATNTITAEKLALGDFINYASWKDKTIDTCPFSSLGDNWSIDTSVYRNSTASYKYITKNISISSKMDGIKIPVSQGEQIYIEFWYKTDPGWTCDTANSKMRIAKSDGSLLKVFPISNIENAEWTKINGVVSISDISIGPYIEVQIYMKGTTLEKQIWIDDIVIKKMSTGELIVDGSITADKISVDTLEAICAKIGGFTIGSNAIYNGTSSLTSTTAGIYLGTDGIRNYKNSNTYVDIKNGVLTAKAANISGTITTSNITATGGTIGGFKLSSTQLSCQTPITEGTASTQYGTYITNYTTQTGLVYKTGSRSYDGSTYSDWSWKTYIRNDGYLYSSSGKIGGWSITSSKIYSGDETSGVVAMRTPTSSTTYVFVAGGTSHSDYSDCPFRVTAGGKVYANRLYITGDTDSTTGNGFYIYDSTNSKYLSFAKADGGIIFPSSYYLFENTVSFNGETSFIGNVGIYGKIINDIVPNTSETYNLGDGSKYYNMLYVKGIRIGASPYDASDGWISTFWKDGNSHQIVARSTDGLTASFGWYGTDEYKTVTQLRGQTVRYVNSSGTTTLSDERMKKDFKDLNAWEEFYSNTEPCAFRYTDGASGRYHIGFKAQQIRNALESSGLTTQDFAGFIQYNVDPLSDEWHGYDTEYGLIYTEFIALNTHMIQKLMKRVNELEEKLKEVVSMYGI